MNALQWLELQPGCTAPGLTTEGLRQPSQLLDPFIKIEHFHMRMPAIAPHPHAGLSSVTYVFEDSPGGLIARDSLGGEYPVGPGGLHWSLAGRGLMHDEFPSRPDLEVSGLQLLVNLPASHKLDEPAVWRLDAARMPVQAGPGWRRTQIFGGDAPLVLPWPAALAMLELDAGASYDLRLPAGEQGVALVLRGRLDAAGPVGRALCLPETLCLRASNACRIALCHGRPLREPLVQHGPFVMNDEAQIVDAIERFQSGGMGRLSPRQL